MTLWDSTLHSESKVVRLKSHWCARLDFETQPHYEAPGRLRLVLEIVWWLTSSEWGCLFVNDPKLALMQPNFWQKKFWATFTFYFSVFIVVFGKQANICFSIGSISKPISSRHHNSTDQAIAIDRYQSYLRKLDNFFSEKQHAAVNTDRKIYYLLIYNFIYDLIYDLISK